MTPHGPGAISQIAIQVSDADRAERFYRDTLGLPLLFRFGEQMFFDGGTLRLLLEAGHEPRGPGHATFCVYLRAPAIDATVARLKSDGVYFEQEPHCVARMPDHELWVALFRDPDNNLLALQDERRRTTP
ncbi:MAG: VOC family protein [Burkholderiaceae bacterium]|jgi:methylmalonyl-CoA/ethylmalonyl-CoA epimerase|nr:VOC family protein [Burkholderiaceae bacterium]